MSNPEASVGYVVNYTHPRTGEVITGLCTAVRYPATVIRDTATGDEFRSVQFKIKPSSGARAFWTISFPAEPL